MFWTLLKTLYFLAWTWEVDQLWWVYPYLHLSGRNAPSRVSTTDAFGLKAPNPSYCSSKYACGNVQVLEVTTLHVLCFLQVEALLLEYMVMSHPCLIWRKLKHSIEQNISKIISEMIKNKWLDLVLWSEHNHGYQKNLRTNSKGPEGSV